MGGYRSVYKMPRGSNSNHGDPTRIIKNASAAVLKCEGGVLSFEK
jgi:hypothetical protein